MSLTLAIPPQRKLCRQSDADLLCRLEQYLPGAPGPDDRLLDRAAWSAFCAALGLDDEDDPRLIPEWYRALLGTDRFRERCDRHDDRGPPEHPTLAAVGTAAKVEVMRRRASRRQELFHSHDRPMDEARHVRAPVFSEGNYRVVGYEHRRDAQHDS